jgi:hypothetical protein
MRRKVWKLVSWVLWLCEEHRDASRAYYVCPPRLGALIMKQSASETYQAILFWCELISHPIQVEMDIRILTGNSKLGEYGNSRTHRFLSGMTGSCESRILKEVGKRIEIP